MFGGLVVIAIGLLLLAFVDRRLLGGAVAKRFAGARRGLSKKRDPFHRRELMKVMLGLDEEALGRLFDIYRERYGAGATRYARKTYVKWKSGDVRPVTATFERFLVELPRVMSFDLKCEVLRAFMAEFGPKERVEMSVTTDDWKEKLAPVVERIVDRCWTAELPAEVTRRLRWLGEGDMKVAAEILRRSQAAEARTAVSLLDAEFAALETLFSDPRVKPRVRHAIKLPCGVVDLDVRRAKR